MCQLGVVLAGIVCHLSADVEPATVHVPPRTADGTDAAHLGCLESAGPAATANVEGPRLIGVTRVHGAETCTGFTFAEELVSRGGEVEIVAVGGRGGTGGGSAAVGRAGGRLRARAGAGARRRVRARALLPRVEALAHGRVRQRRGRFTGQFVALGRQHRQRRAA